MSLEGAEEIGRALAVELKASIAPLKEEIKRYSLENKILEGRLEALETQLAVIEEPDYTELNILGDRITRLENREPERGPPGKDGLDADLASIDLAIQEAVAAIPVINGKDGKNGERGWQGESGVGVAGALIDKEGSLILTLTDGKLANLGNVIGREGRSITREEVAAMISDEVEKFPKPKDGKDGLNFELPVFDGERTITWVTADGRTATHIVLPIPIHRGVYKSDREYQRGDCVTYDGSTWNAKEDCKGVLPGSVQGADTWQLTTKRGRDGKDGKSIQGPPGPEGKPGRDLTQMDFDGKKF